MKIAKVLINTSVKSLNKVYDYLVPEKMEQDIKIGKRVLVSFGKGRSDEEAIIVKIEEKTAEELKSYNYKLKEIIEILDEVSYINESRLKLAKYISFLYFCNVYDALKLMLPPGTKSKNTKKSLNTKQNTLVKLIKNQEEIMEDIENNVITSAKHIKLLTFLMYNDYVLINDIIDGLEISRQVINTVEKNGYITLEKVDIKPDFLTEFKVSPTEPKKPTPEQEFAIDRINSYIDSNEYKQCLLFGVTGSGKTEVYLQVIKRVLEKGKRAIVLVPEISLTYQTVNRFVSRFGNNIAILHSKMTVSKRKEEYKRIKNGEVDIIIGARSAIFAPVDNLGLVIIDEEHDGSYYSQTTPKYSTKEVASYICKENNATLILGSATPEISSFYKAQVTMENRPGTAVMPKIEIVNMKYDRVLGNTSDISLRLKEEIKKNIDKNEQTMIFLNRRGYLSYLRCNECSYIFKCPNCDVAFVYHKTSNLLHCHYCSHVERNVHKCPCCGSENISSSTIGTQRLEEELKEIFPGVTTLRMDADTTVAKDSHQKILDKFKNENINILIGTQMISKGHDIENVTLVGILGVDTMLGMDDYLSSERAFSNISQVSGRAGRAKLPGRVLIQTNDPDNYILNAVINNSYIEFYEKEIKHRKKFGYPPFIDIVLFEISGRNFYLVKSEIDRLYNILNSENTGIYKVFNPKAPFIQKINNKFRVNIIVKTKLNTNSYNKLYEKINIFNKTKKNGVNMVVTRNPIFIG